MKENEKTDFAKMLTAVGELYGKKISLPLLSIYWAALEGFNFTDIRCAITSHVNNSDVGQFMPKPADIVRYLEGNSDARALQAWSKVESAIRRLGGYESVAFDDPIIHIVIVEMGDWPTLCATLVDEMSFRANEFMKRYKSYIHIKLTHFPKYLGGIFEHENRWNSHENNTTPALVGDVRLASSVISRGNMTQAVAIHRDHVLAVDCIKKHLHSGKGYLPKMSKIRIHWNSFKISVVR